jgi:hypothetical protein
MPVAIWDSYGRQLKVLSSSLGGNKGDHKIPQERQPGEEP